jgi:hypothetical protein
MTLVSINGVELPTPSTYQVGIQDLNKAQRNARGTMIIERIATKRKIELSWKHLKNDQLQQLLNLVKNTFFEVKYLDPQTGIENTGTFYSGDRKIGAMDYFDNNIRWKDIKFNIVER